MNALTPRSPLRPTGPARRLVTLVAAGALAVAAAACGGSSAASATLDSATLATRGDAVCTAFNHQANVASHQISTSPRAGFTALVAAYDREVSALHELHPSAADQTRFGRLVGMISKERPIIQAFEKHTRGKDSAAVRADAGHAFALAAQVSGIAVGLSMTQCALSVDTTAPPTSAADYHQTIASECYAATAAIQQLRKPAQTSDLATYARQADPLFDQELRDLLAQPKPSGASVASIQPWINTQQLAKQYLDAVGKAAAINDVSTLQNNLAQLKAETAHAHSAALAAGISGCAG